jgi:hypothetical protein
MRMEKSSLPVGWDLTGSHRPIFAGPLTYLCYWSVSTLHGTARGFWFASNSISLIRVAIQVI